MLVSKRRQVGIRVSIEPRYIDVNTSFGFSFDISAILANFVSIIFCCFISLLFSLLTLRLDNVSLTKAVLRKSLLSFRFIIPNIYNTMNLYDCQQFIWFLSFDCYPYLF